MSRLIGRRYDSTRWIDPPATIDRKIENNLAFETPSFFTNPKWRAFMFDFRFTISVAQYVFIDIREETAW